MNFCYLLRINLNRVFVIVSLLIYPSVASSDNIGNFANKLFNHYEYDDKINNYLKSFFSFGNSKKNKSSKTTQSFSKDTSKISKHSLKIKSKNKLIYGFGNGQSLQINPSNINNKITYHRTPFSYFEIKRDSVLYGFKLDF